MGLKDTKSYTRSSVMVNQLPGYSSILVYIGESMTRQIAFL